MMFQTEPQPFQYNQPHIHSSVAPTKHHDHVPRTYRDIQSIPDILVYLAHFAVHLTFYLTLADKIFVGYEIIFIALNVAFYLTVLFLMCKLLDLGGDYLALAIAFFILSLITFLVDTTTPDVKSQVLFNIVSVGVFYIAIEIRNIVTNKIENYKSMNK